MESQSDKLQELIAKMDSLESSFNQPSDLDPQYLEMARKDMETMSSDDDVAIMIAELYQKLHLQYKDQSYSPEQQLAWHKKHGEE